MVAVELHNATNYSTIEYTSGLVELSTGGNISIGTIPTVLSGIMRLSPKMVSRKERKAFLKICRE